MDKTILVLSVSIFLTSILIHYLIISGLTNRKLFKFLEKTKEKEYKQEKDFEISEKQEYLKNKLKELLKNFIDVTEKHNINYIVTAGTLLGAVRHSDYIPWDNDIDLALDTEDLQKLKLLEDELKEKNMVIKFPKKNLISTKYTHNIPQLYYINKTDFDNDDCHIDLFEYIKKDNMYIQKNSWCRYKWPGEYFFEEEFENPKKLDFGYLKVNCPSNYHSVLRRMYGDWTRMIN